MKSWCKILILLGGLVFTQCSNKISPFELQAGDLLFQDLDCGPLCEAIEKVTKGIHQADFSHMGIVDTLNGMPVVIEAITTGVSVTPIDEFLSRSRDSLGRPKVVVGRLIPQLQNLIPAMLHFAKSKIGLPYDAVYQAGDSCYYCSELIHDAFLQASHDSTIFYMQPMTFKQVNDTLIFPVWQDYFDALHVPVPEGKPGINPGAISRSPAIDIVYTYGFPEGWDTTMIGMK